MTPRRTASTLLIAFALCAGCDSPYDLITTPPPDAGTTLPIKSDLYLAIDAKINGQPVDALLDTGTVLFNLVPPSAIERFGLKKATINPYAEDQTGNVGVCGGVSTDVKFNDSLYTADRLEVGDVVVENVAFVVLEEEGFDTFQSISVDCILNGALLAKLDWRIDHEGGELTLLPTGALSRPDTAAPITIIGPNAPPLLQLFYGAVPRIGGLTTAVKFVDGQHEEVESVIDTGGGIEIAMGQSLFDDTGWSLDTLPNISTGLFGAGGDCTTRRFRAPFLSVDRLDYVDVHTVILPASDIGLIGWRFLANHETVTVSPSGRWIEFKKGADTDANFSAPLVSFGLELKARTDGVYDVRRVDDDSDAAMNGVKKGDKLLEVNGVNVGTLEGKSLLFGPKTMRAGVATFLIEDEAANQFAVELTAKPIL